MEGVEADLGCESIDMRVLLGRLPQSHPQDHIHIHIQTIISSVTTSCGKCEQTYGICNIICSSASLSSSTSLFPRSAHVFLTMARPDPLTRSLRVRIPSKSIWS